MNEQLANLRRSPEFAEEMLVADVQSVLEQLMHDKGCSRTDLARLMGVSKARVTQIFSDQHNFTIRLIARAFHALGEQVCLSVKPESGCNTSDWHGKTRRVDGDRRRRETDARGKAVWQIAESDETGPAGHTQDVLMPILASALQRYAEFAGAKDATASKDAAHDWDKYGGNVFALRK